MADDVIDEDFYCSAGCYENGNCSVAKVCLSGCDNRHRKHPTPEQFKEEYGKEWTGAVYSHCTCSDDGDYNDCASDKCKYFEWGDGEEYGCLVEPITVCACTPFGKPDNKWRPK